jgi:hypothetical protein
MALNTTTLETNLNTKMNATTGTTEGKEFLLLGKAVEALTPTVTVNSVITEGTTQVGLVNTAGTTQVGLVNTEGSTQVAAVQAAGSNYATLSGATFTGDVDLGTNKIKFSNVYSTLGDLPSAASYHGMFAHVHATGKAYFAHAGSWHPLVHLDSSGDLVLTGSITADSYVGIENTVVLNGPTVNGPTSALYTGVANTFTFSSTSELSTATIVSFTYKIDDGSETTVSASGGAASPTITVTGTNGTTVALKVFATDSLGNKSATTSHSVNLVNVTFSTPTVTLDTTTITGSAYSASGGDASAHTSTDWQIASDANFTTIVYQSLADTGNLLSKTHGQALTANTTYYARARYIDANGASSDYGTVSYTTPPAGQQAFTTPGTFSWVAPANVTSVSVVAVGGGGGGSGAHDSNGGTGGGLGWKNNISVTPGQSYTVVVGSAGIGSNGGSNGGNGNDSYFISGSTVKGGGGSGGWTTSASYSGGLNTGGDFVGDGGGDGGDNRASLNNNHRSGGAGAGGYSGKGGSAGSYNGDGMVEPVAGGGGGGAGYGFNNGACSGGGGVGIMGLGTTGTNATGVGSYVGNPGIGGSGGSDASDTYMGSSSYYRGDAGEYGGAGGGSSNSAGNYGGNGGVGAVRIIWGPSRAFPSTNTVDV